MKRIPAAAASEGSASVSTLPKTTSECASEAGSKTGLEHPARTAPGRPEVDQDDLVVPHGLLERLARDRAGRQVPSSPWNTPTGGVKDGGPKEFWSRSSPRRPPHAPTRSGSGSGHCFGGLREPDVDGRRGGQGVVDGAVRGDGEQRVPPPRRQPGWRRHLEPDRDDARGPAAGLVPGGDFEPVRRQP